MRVLVSGATGIVGRFVVEHLLARGHDVVAGVRVEPATPPLSRPAFSRPPFSRTVETTFLSLENDAPLPDFTGCDGFVHAAFEHVPGCYRGGEGDDPAGFRRANVEGSRRLFEAAWQAGVKRCVFLSSRAVYGPAPDGSLLSEDLEPAPESLYGIVKWEAEKALAALHSERFVPASLRSTGVYGLMEGVAHKWEALARDYLSGLPVADRVGTEVHGDDLAAAVLLLLTADADLIGNSAFNVSDRLTSHRDVLAELQQATACVHPLPDPIERCTFSCMDTTRLRALGWRPGGQDRFRADIAALAERIAAGR